MTLFLIMCNKHFHSSLSKEPQLDFRFFPCTSSRNSWFFPSFKHHIYIYSFLFIISLFDYKYHWSTLDNPVSITTRPTRILRQILLEITWLIYHIFFLCPRGKLKLKIKPVLLKYCSHINLFSQLAIEQYLDQESTKHVVFGEKFSSEVSLVIRRYLSTYTSRLSIKCVIG